MPTSTAPAVSAGLPRTGPSRRLADLGRRVARGLTWPDFTTPRATYVMRSLLAAWLALTVAYLIGLEMPYSAASTVLLVINPVQGAVIGKGTWRVLGTLVGMAMAIVLMGAFAQMPWLFLLGFGGWLGVCVAAMTLLRHFRASGAVVAGYTVGLATYGALGHPQQTFEHVIGRGSTVMLGVVCLGLVSALFSRRSVRGRLQAQLARLAAATAQVIAIQPATAADGARLAPARRELMAEIYGVDDVLALGQAESADVAQRAVAVRHAMASLFAALIGGPPPLPAHSSSARSLCAFQALQPTLEAAWRSAERSLACGAQGIGPAVRGLREARARLIAAMDVLIGTIGSDSIDPVQQAALCITGERLIEQMDDYLAALEGIAALHRTRPSHARGALRPVHFHRDTAAALQNGLRAMLTLVLAGAFWIITGWPHGDMMLLVLAPYCALLATSGNSAAGAIEFVKGTVLAVPMAFVCAFGVLPHISGLPLLLVVLGLFWMPGIYATSTPQHGLAGLAYLVGFNTLTAADNPMHYDLGLFLNASVAWVLATLFTLLGFRLLLPRKPARDVERLRCRIRDEALALLGGARFPHRKHHLWQRRQQHRMAQLGALLKAQPAAMEQALGDALASLHLGRELLRLRQWLDSPSAGPGESACRPLVALALYRMARRAQAPARAARHARRAARSLGRAGAGCARAAQPYRLAATLIDIAELLESHAGYFCPPTRGQGRRHVHAQ